MNGDERSASLADLSSHRDLQSRFREVVSLAKRDLPRDHFVESLFRALSGDAPARWMVAWGRIDGTWKPILRFVPQHSEADTDSEAVTFVDEEVASVGIAAVRACLDDAHERASQHRQMDDRFELLTLRVDAEHPVILQMAINRPVACPGESGGWSSGTDDADSIKTAGELLEAYGQLYEDFDRNRTMRRLQDSLSHQDRFSRVIRSIHGSLDLDRTAHEIVAASATFAGCSRACLLVHQNGRFRVAAVSGLSTLDHRSPAIAALTSLASAVAQSGETLVHGLDERTRPPQVSQPLEQYLDWSHALGLIAVGLKRPSGDAVVDPTERQTGQRRDATDDGHRESPMLGVMVLETQDADSLSHLREDLGQWSSHFSLALHNAITHNRLPLRRVGERLRTLQEARWWRHGGRLGIVAGAIAALVSALVWIPAPLKVEASGALRPANLFNAFAPRDSVVSDVQVDHDDRVVVGMPLVLLESPELELELRRVEGAIESTEQELRAAEAARRRGSQAGGLAHEDAGGVAASETRLRAVLDSYQRQLELLQDEHKTLTVRSTIEGHVLSWQVRHTLLGRPVKRGQRLLQIAAADTPWTLSLELPDREAGHLLDARASFKPDLDVEYILATDPRRRRIGKVVEVAQVTSISDRGDPIVEVTVSIDPDDLQLPRSGAQVRAEIDCGSRALGYVWFRRLWDAIWSWISL